MLRVLCSLQETGKVVTSGKVRKATSRDLKPFGAPSASYGKGGKGKAGKQDEPDSEEEDENQDTYILGTLVLEFQGDITAESFKCVTHTHTHTLPIQAAHVCLVLCIHSSYCTTVAVHMHASACRACVLRRVVICSVHRSRVGAALALASRQQQARCQARHSTQPMALLQPP